MTLAKIATVMTSERNAFMAPPSFPYGSAGAGFSAMIRRTPFTAPRALPR